MSDKPILRIEIKRPSFEYVKKAYEEINGIGNQENNYTKAELRYDFWGGRIQKAFEKEKEQYINTCAVRVSYALNKGGMLLKESLIKNAKHIDKHKAILHDIKKDIERYSRIDKDNNYYITNSIDMETFLWIKWGVPELAQKEMKNKIQNIEFLDKLKKFNKQGIITMRIHFSDAQGHTTLWDKDHFTDGSNYLQRNDTIVTEAHFWELLED
ncbi:T6SS effector amidase Tae4 family protein [Helicobacter sp. MIT 05-5294]|uniref:T6SS effector amidase Tae4 family protein n=1 Tax=Helicobacter sp. MIT 05-5294 TaxID=1548150 RepID=UPI0018834F70|nr:T6SS effector amidase Tae4 family protein [Helicobacter sp. MIT 05-5294]